MKKIGLISWYNSTNYGTQLQAYALQIALKKKGHKVSYIEYLPRKLTFIRLWVSHFRDKYNLRQRNLQEKKVDCFIKDTINIRKVSNIIDYNKMLNEFDLFMTGSDQIWNPYYLSTFFLLDWIKNKKKVAYASSIGVDSIPDSMKEIYRKALSDFAHIGIREKIGCDVINNILGSEIAKKVLDPTFLLTYDDWHFFSKSVIPTITISDNFILCYVLGQNESYKKVISEIWRKSGIKKLVIIKSTENPNFNLVNASLYENGTSKDFVYLLRKAELVITDSFHATALCINNEVSFIELLRFQNGDAYSQNSRIIELLSHYSLSDQIYDSGQYKFNIDFSLSQKILKLDRKESNLFLDKAIEDLELV